MFPLIAIGGVIGAVMSIAKGAAWVADQLDSGKSTTSVGGKGDGKPVTDAKASPFAATLAAQTAGQTMPSSAIPAVSPALIPQTHGADYDMLARMKAGVIAYANVGQHHSNHPKSSSATSDDNPVTRA